MIDTAKIAESAEQEIEELRLRMYAASGKEVYDHALSIFASEQMACLLTQHQGTITEFVEELAYTYGAERARSVISRLEELAAQGSVLSVFVDWFLSQDSVNLSDMIRCGRFRISWAPHNLKSHLIISAARNQRSFRCHRK